MALTADDAQDERLALDALGWILADAARADRLLALTGLSPDHLRAALTDRATQGAILGFLMAHEADLLACAAVLAVSPTRLAAAAMRLGGGAEEAA